jgi:hypothetical protein
MKEPNMTTNVMRSQLSRLYGQLYAFQVGASQPGTSIAASTQEGAGATEEAAAAA